MPTIEEMLEQDPKFIPATVGFFVKDDKILLGRRKNTKLGQDIYSGVGGKVGDHEEFKDETHEEGFIREVQEEFGVTPTKMKRAGRVRFIYPTASKWQMDVVIFLVEEWSGEIIETDAMKPVWFDQNALPHENMWGDNMYWIPKILAGEKVDFAFVFDDQSNLLDMKEL